MSLTTKVLIGFGVVAAVVGVALLVMRKQSDGAKSTGFFGFSIPNPFGPSPLPSPASTQVPGPPPSPPGAVGSALKQIQTGANKVTSTAQDLKKAADALKELRNAFKSN